MGFRNGERRCLGALVAASTLIGILAFEALPAFATPPPAIQIQDSTGTYSQAVDASGNAAVTAIPAASATIGGATRLCTGQISPSGSPEVAPNCNTGPLQVYAYQLDNTMNTLPSWFQIFDSGSSITLPSGSAPSGEIEVPPGAVVTIPISVGDAFSAGLTIGCTTAPTGSTTPVSKSGYTIWGKK